MTSKSYHGSAGRLGAACVFAVAALGVVHLLYQAGYTVDDAYITFRYSHHLARGLGAVFNPGEYAKGYSNTLYVWLMAIPELLGRDPIVFSKSIGVLAYMALVLVTFRESQAVLGPWLSALAAPAMLALSLPIAVWYVAGLETGLYTTLLTAAVLVRLREQATQGPPYSALLFSAAVLTRPEGIAFFVAMAVHDLAVHALERRAPRLADLAWYAAAPCVWAGELLVSKAYYGAYLPTTFYAKVAASSHLLGTLDALQSSLLAQCKPGSYLRTGLGSVGGTWAVAFAALALLDRQRFRHNAAFTLMVLAQTAFIVRSGDDWMPASRFCVPMLPFLFLLFTGAVARAASHLGNARTLGAAGLLGLYLALLATRPWVLQSSVGVTVDAKPFLQQGTELASLLPAGSILASFDVGGHGYAGDSLDVLDLGGLTDSVLASCRWRSRNCKGYVSAVLPDLIRRHPGKRHGEAFYRELKQTDAYLELGGGRFLLKRELALVSTPPTWSQALGPSDAAAGLSVVASELPEHCSPGRRLRGVLYWRANAETRAGVLARRLILRRSSQATDARASAVLWLHYYPVELWQPDALFVDRLSFDAPNTPGKYELAIELGDHRQQTVGELEVVGADATRQLAANLSAQALRRARTNEPQRALAELRDAVWTDSSESVAVRYDSVAVPAARAMLQRGLTTRDVQTALRTLDSARALLHRAYWETGRSSAALRSAIDDVGSARRRLLRSILPPSPG